MLNDYFFLKCLFFLAVRNVRTKALEYLLCTINSLVLQYNIN